MTENKQTGNTKYVQLQGQDPYRQVMFTWLRRVLSNLTAWDTRQAWPRRVQEVEGTDPTSGQAPSLAGSVVSPQHINHSHIHIARHHSRSPCILENHVKARNSPPQALGRHRGLFLWQVIPSNLRTKHFYDLHLIGEETGTERYF